MCIRDSLKIIRITALQKSNPTPSLQYEGYRTYNVPFPMWELQSAVRYSLQHYVLTSECTTRGCAMAALLALYDVI